MHKLLLAIVLCGLFCMPLFAAEYPAAEVFGGYQLLHSEDMNMHGFSGAVEGNITQNFGIVGEYGLGIKTETFSGTDVTIKEHSFMAGPRFSYRADKFRVFGHALFGGNRLSGGASVEGISAGASTTGFGMAFGGGVDFAASQRIWIRPVQFDVFRIHHSVMDVSGWGTQYRYSAGIVFKFGSKGAN